MLRLSCLSSTAVVLTPMLCICAAVSWTGTSGVSIFVPGMDGAGSFAPAGGPQATGCTSPDLCIFIAMGCFAQMDRDVQIPSITARNAIHTNEDLKTYVFNSCYLLSQILYGL